MRCLAGLVAFVVGLPLLTVADAAGNGPPLDPEQHVFPLVGSVSYGPYHHDYPATDIFAPIGTPVVACVAATVVHVSRADVGLGGLTVTLRADDGWLYYYAHLSVVADDLRVGERVELGHYLGRSGNTGNARFTAPHLHFGISRGDHIAGEISPFPYLNAWPRVAS
jgi:peptidoglycan LD-endopeptidase LytH